MLIPLFKSIWSRILPTSLVTISLMASMVLLLSIERIQQGAEEGFAVGAEQQLLGEGHSSMRDDRKWQGKLAQARVDDAWGVLDVYSDGGADGAGTPAASAEYGWLVGGTDEDSLEVWAEGAACKGGWSPWRDGLHQS